MTETKYSRPAAAVGVVALSAALAACSSGPDAASAADGGEMASVRISIGTDPSFAAAYVAEQQGMFEDAGLSVEFVNTGGGPASVQNVSAGVADIAINGDATTLPLLPQHSKLKVLGVFEESDTLFKVVLREGVEPADIEKMAYGPGLRHYMTVRYLESEGIDPSSVELINADSPEFPAILGNGDADGYVSFEPWVSRGVEQGGRVVADSGDFGAGFTQWIVVNGDWLSENEETAAKFVSVLDEAAELVESDPDLAIRDTMTAIKVDEPTARSAIEEITFNVREFTPADFEAAGQLMKFFESSDVIDAPIDLDKFILADWLKTHVLN
ncbi:ABC transporter substrate-binding protein [Georgenia yuyongxinii]|uniref:ABC transporter substrate-binding protein n=1 Tax=Georgenia yuyongxinii TaxID=2589797 RepID=A0A5B8C2V9_9MICO|nr:ABC transporter substrate-binding protein [Georgenia yuyongxinii]QDC23861.1 ABC transporter substrate-binding protein [Georgenia yuyongxinii]